MWFLWSIREIWTTKWKSYKDSPHSFHSQKNKTFIARGRKLSTVKQVFLAENSIIEGHTLYRIHRSLFLSFSVFLSLVEYSLHTWIFSYVKIRLKSVAYANQISIVRVLKMSSVHHKYSLLISIYVKRSLCQIDYFRLLSPNGTDFEDKSLVVFYRNLEEFLSYSFSVRLLKKNYFFYLYNGLIHRLKRDNISRVVWSC